MTDLRKQISNIVEDHQECLVLAKSVGSSEVYEGTTATEEDIAKGKTAYSKGRQITGVAKLGIIKSPTEPTGENRKLIWIAKSNNLLKTNNFGVSKTNKVRYYYDSNGVRTKSEGANSWIIYYVAVPENCIGKEMCFSFNGYSNQDYSVQYMIHNQVRLVPINDFNVAPTESQYCTLSKTDKRYSIKFVATQDHMYMIHDLAESNMSTTELKTYNHQLEIGSEPTAYEPFAEPKVYIENDEDVYQEIYEYASL